MTFEVREGDCYRYTGTLLDDQGDPVLKAALTTLTLTLYNADTMDGAIVNDRDHQDALTADDITVGDTDGSITWTLAPEDTAILNPRRGHERHTALFEWTTNTGTTGSHEVTFLVANVRQRPVPA